MVNGIIVGIVKDNKDPDAMHRVLVEYPVESGETKLQSSWCRMMSPMAGKLRGLVMIPDIGSEVVLCMAYRSMSPYVLGAVYNGSADKPEPYKNDDKKDHLKVFWSRNDHMVIFDDEPGKEKVQIGAQAPTRLDVTSAPIWQSLDSAQKTITQYSDKDTMVDAKETISLKCKNLVLTASNTITASAAAKDVNIKGSQLSATAAATHSYTAPRIDVNPSGTPAAPKPALPLPPHSHPPTKAG